MDCVAVVDQGLGLLHPRGRQDGVHRAGNILAAHGAAHLVARVTPDADADRGGSQEGTWDRDSDEVEKGVVWIAS